jgi:hypothetical protein
MAAPFGSAFGRSGYWFVVIGYWQIQKPKTNNHQPRTASGASI